MVDKRVSFAYGDGRALRAHVEEPHEELGEDRHDAGDDHQAHADPPGDGPEQAPCALRAVLRTLLLEDRDHQRGEHVEQDRGHGVHHEERVDQGVGVGRGAVYTGEHDLADEAEDPREDPEERDDGGRARDLPDAHRTGFIP